MSPGTPVTITLDEPLSGRALLDGGLYPPSPPTGPAAVLAHAPTPAASPSTAPTRGPALARASRPPAGGVRVTSSASQEPDLSNTSGARFTLRLEDGAVRRGRAACWWSEDRSFVEHVSVNQVRPDGQGIQISLSASPIDGPSLWVQERRGPTWDSRAGGTLEVATPLPAKGVATFSDLPGRRSTTDPITGSFGWRCDEPPPRDAGHTDATVMLTITGPISISHTSSGFCTWVDRPAGRQVSHVDAYRDRVALGDGRYIGLTLGLEPRAPNPTVRPYFHISDATFDENEDLHAPFTTWPTTWLDDLSSGSARVFALRDQEDESDDLPSFLDATVAGAVITWDCGAPPETTSGEDDVEARLTSAGTVTLDFEDASLASVSAPADCLADRDDYYVDIGDVAANLVIDGHRARIARVDWLQRYLVLFLDEDGKPVGEYIAEDDRGVHSGEGDEGLSTTGPVAFTPGSVLTPPALFGATTPEPFRATITIECPLPAYWQEVRDGDSPDTTIGAAVDDAQVVVVAHPVGLEPLITAGTDPDGPHGLDVLRMRLDDVLKRPDGMGQVRTIDLVVPHLAGMTDDELRTIMPSGPVLLLLDEAGRRIPRRNGQPRYTLADPGQGVLRDLDGLTHLDGLVHARDASTASAFPDGWEARPFADLVAAIERHLHP